MRTKPTGIRFDPEKIEYIKQREKLKSNQQVVDLLVNKYWWEHKIPIPTYKESPPLTLKGEDLMGNAKTIIPENKPVFHHKGYEQYKSEKRECETGEQWETLKKEILSDPYLTKIQKDTIIKYN